MLFALLYLLIQVSEATKSRLVLKHIFHKSSENPHIFLRNDLTRDDYNVFVANGGKTDFEIQHYPSLDSTKVIFYTIEMCFT